MEATRGLLIDACRTLAETDVEFVVAGGWVPYLRGQNNSIQHPGTRDVDLLFNDSLEPIKFAVQALLRAGYVPSAKHPFQLLKILAVETQKFAFNVDLMHPREGSFGDDLFQDIFDLGIREDYELVETHVIKSIALPSAHIIFEKQLWSMFDVNGILPNGNSINCSIPLMDEIGLILSKCASVSQSKRDRDAFDIFVLLSGSHRATIAERLLKLEKSSQQAAEQLRKLRTFIHNHANTFDARVLKYSKGEFGAGAAAKIRAVLVQK
jgi:hypothetical protein